MSTASRSFEGRATFIDALRGIAALSVACYHIFRYGPLPEQAAQVVPGFLQVWFNHGWIGVQVFFVISGFVIAYSVRNAWVTPAFLGNYALRRSIRLDPPYWATIAIVLLVHWVFALKFGFDSPMDVPEPMTSPLSWQLVLAHMLYLQNILESQFVQSILKMQYKFENLSAGFWTLCIEVQFYLLYVVGLGIAQRISNRPRPAPPPPIAGQTGPSQSAAPRAVGAVGLLVVFAPIAVLSLFWWNLDSATDMWIIHFFCMFFLGCAAWWALDGRVPSRVFWGYVSLLLVRLALDAREAYGEALLDGSTTATGLGDAAASSIDLKVALVAGIAVYLLGRAGRLGTTLNYRWLQYLGRISYSLYLIHFPVGHVVTTLGYEHMQVNGTLSPVGAAGWLLAALVASFIAAHILYTFVEGPSVRLSSRFKRAETPQRPSGVLQ
ncbi:MAG: acyltransferase [Planctomycetaceae bacterium]|nr:acyltransferase [Planctomycetaceae bacterium]